MSDGTKFIGQSKMNLNGGLEMQQQLAMPVVPENHWKVECFDKDGKLKWVEEFDNLVVTAGKNKLLDATLKTGLTTPAWYVGLVDNSGWTAYAAGDTMSSHTGWTESAAYSNANRPAFTPGTVSGGSVDNSGSKAVFNINNTATIRGAFMCDNNTVSGSTGILYGEGDFSTPRSVISGDTLNVTITATA